MCESALHLLRLPGRTRGSWMLGLLREDEASQSNWIRVNAGLGPSASLGSGCCICCTCHGGNCSCLVSGEGELVVGGLWMVLVSERVKPPTFTPGDVNLAIKQTTTCDQPSHVNHASPSPSQVKAPDVHRKSVLWSMHSLATVCVCLCVMDMALQVHRRDCKLEATAGRL